MNLLKFIQKFPSEENSLKTFVRYRLERGIACKHCNEEIKHCIVKAPKRFQCSKCRKRVSYKSEAMMEKSEIGIQVWFNIVSFDDFN